MNEKSIKVSNTITAIVNKLPDGVSKLMKAALSIKISALERPAALGYIVAALTAVYTISGQKVEAETLAINAEEFYTRLLEKYPHATIEEIKIALRNGVYDEYGDYYGLNVKSFMHFVKCFLYSDERREAFKEYESAKSRLLQTATPSPEINESNTVNYINELYGKFRFNELEFDLIPPFIYDVLLRKQIVSETLPINGAAERLRQQKQSDYSLVKSYASKLFSLSKESALIIVAKQTAIWELFSNAKENKKDKII